MPWLDAPDFNVPLPTVALESGWEVGAAGDVDGDGAADVLVWTDSE